MTALSTPREYAYAAQAFLAGWGIGPDALVTEEEGAPVREWASTIDSALLGPERYTRAVALRSWLVFLQDTYGVTASVETLQVRFGTRDFDDAIGNVWIPGPRKFTRATNAVQFYRIGADSQSAVDFSTRYFSGLRAVASTPTTWVGFSPDARVVIVYRVVVPEAREDYSWAEVAEKDAAGLCPASPDYALPHIPAGDGTCSECGAAIDDSTHDAAIERSIAEHDAALDANVEG